MYQESTDVDSLMILHILRELCGKCTIIKNFNWTFSHSSFYFKVFSLPMLKYSVGNKEGFSGKGEAILMQHSFYGEGMNFLLCS